MEIQYTMNKHRAIIDRLPNFIDRYFYFDRISIGALYAISGIQHQFPEEVFV